MLPVLEISQAVLTSPQMHEWQLRPVVFNDFAVAMESLQGRAGLERLLDCSKQTRV